jgi:hypothetical protein
MDAKLTLKLDKSVIEKAKEYAAENKESLSRLIENYLKAITSKQTADIEITPFVKSMSTSVSMPVDVDKKDYYEYLMEKHK